jgi:hypothetical protein
MIKSRFTQHDALTELEDLMNEIFRRRADNVPAVPWVSLLVPDVFKFTCLWIGKLIYFPHAFTCHVE